MHRCFPSCSNIYKSTPSVFTVIAMRKPTYHFSYSLHRYGVPAILITHGWSITSILKLSAEACRKEGAEMAMKTTDRPQGATNATTCLCSRLSRHSRTPGWRGLPHAFGCSRSAPMFTSCGQPMLSSFSDSIVFINVVGDMLNCFENVRIK